MPVNVTVDGLTTNQTPIMGVSEPIWHLLWQAFLSKECNADHDFLAVVEFGITTTVPPGVTT
jgi:hypothetical protein